MIDHEHALNCLIISTGEIEYVTEKHLTADFFDSQLEKDVFTMVLDHHLTYGNVPDISAVKQAYPDFSLEEQPESLRYYVDLVRDEYLRSRLFADLGDRILNDPERFVEGTHGGERLWDELSDIVVSNRMAVPVGEDTDLFGSAWDYLEPILDARKISGAVPGVTTGFPSFDLSTGGLQEERLMTLIGIPKSGKSSMALRIALTAAMSGCRTVFVTFEMTNQEQIDRTASLISGVPLTNILRGDLLPAERKRLEQAFKKMSGLSGFFTLVEDRESMTTLDGIQAKIAKYNPGFVVVDGAYMMQDTDPRNLPGSWQALTNISRGLKRLAQNNRIPILITVQALESKSKGGLVSSSAGYTSAWSQDADVFFGVERMKDAPDYSVLKVLLSRAGPKTESYVNIGWDKGEIKEVDLALIPTQQSTSDGSF